MRSFQSDLLEWIAGLLKSLKIRGLYLREGGEGRWGGGGGPDFVILAVLFCGDNL
jgi:hypothetical protein